MFPTFPWWASSQNRSLREKVGSHIIIPGWKKPSNLFSLDGLIRVRVMADGNQAGNYYRFFGFFENDSERYFEIFSSWDLDIPWEKLETGIQISGGGHNWKVSELTEFRKGFVFEFERVKV
jgi:hypothetical protein